MSGLNGNGTHAAAPAALTAGELRNRLMIRPVERTAPVIVQLPDGTRLPVAAVGVSRDGVTLFVTPAAPAPVLSDPDR